MFTYNIQLANFKTDQIQECGSVTKDQAIKVLKEFPFKDQLKDSLILPDGCLPTITFNEDTDKSFIAFWFDESEKFTVLCTMGKQNMAKDQFTDDFNIILKCLEAFFDKNYEAICQLCNYKKGFFKRLLNIA